MSWIERLRKFIPRPFKFIQKQLDIQQQWAAFKINIRPHRYKISILVLAITFPLYQPYLVRGFDRVKKTTSTYFQQQMAPEKPAFEWLQNFLKHLFDHIFSDKYLRGEALDFVFSLIKDQQFVANILELLVSALKSQKFMSELKLALKEIIVDELKDQQVKKSLISLVSEILGDPQVKESLSKLIQDVFSSQQSIDTIVSLLKKGITNDEVKTALGEAVNFSVREVLSDQQTLDQLKIFIFFLLRKFETDDQIKGMMDILFAKGLGLVKKKKDTQLQKVLRPKKSDLVN